MDLNLGTLQILVYRSEDVSDDASSICTAHSLQFNLSAEAATPAKAVQRLLELIAAHGEFCAERKIRPLELAPDVYFKAFSLGKPFTIPGKNIDARVASSLQGLMGLRKSPALDRLLQINDVRGRQAENESLEDLVAATAG